MKEEVVIYLIDKHTNQVYYLKKDHGPKHIIDKLVGFGGEIEQQDVGDSYFDTILNAIKRELREEVEENTNLSLNLDKLQIIYQGKFITKEIVGHICKAEIAIKLPEGPIKREGIGVYKPINYHQTKPEEFPKDDLVWLDTLLFSDETINIDFR